MSTEFSPNRLRFLKEGTTPLQHIAARSSALKQTPRVAQDVIPDPPSGSSSEAQINGAGAAQVEIRINIEAIIEASIQGEESVTRSTQEFFWAVVEGCKEVCGAAPAGRFKLAISKGCAHEAGRVPPPVSMTEATCGRQASLGACGTSIELTYPYRDVVLELGECRRHLEEMKTTIQSELSLTSQLLTLNLETRVRVTLDLRLSIIPNHPVPIEEIDKPINDAGVKDPSASPLPESEREPLAAQAISPDKASRKDSNGHCAPILIFNGKSQDWLEINKGWGLDA